MNNNNLTTTVICLALWTVFCFFAGYKYHEYKSKEDNTFHLEFKRWDR